MPKLFSLVEMHRSSIIGVGGTAKSDNSMGEGVGSSQSGVHMVKNKLEPARH